MLYLYVYALPVTLQRIFLLLNVTNINLCFWLHCDVCLNNLTDNNSLVIFTAHDQIKLSQQKQYYHLTADILFAFN